MSQINISEQLQSVERSIHVYKKDNNELVKEINIDFIQLSSILTVISPKQDDPLLYDFYELGELELNWFKQYVVLDENFDLYYYILVCLGIYK